MEAGVLLYEIIVFVILVPALVGSALTKTIGDRAKKRGHTPLAVRSERIVVTAIWVSIVLSGLVWAFGPFNFLSTLTVSAIAGIAITLSLQTTIQNVIAGMMLMRTRFLRVGDLVLFSGIKGRVASVGLITIVIKAEDGTLTSVANSNLLSGPFTNYTASSRLAGEY